MRYRMGTPYRELHEALHPVERDPGGSNYFSEVKHEHDPKLFDPGTDHVRADIRAGILKLVHEHLAPRYTGHESWTTVWIAGSALSFQWSRDTRGIGDLDILIGIDMATFYANNPHLKWFSEKAIARRMNEDFREHLYPLTKEWRGFEVTFYVNPGTGTDIRKINPYAAYNLTTDEWTVRPPDLGEDWGPDRIDPSWWRAVDAETERAEELIERYDRLARAILAAPEGPQRVNLLREAQIVIEQVTELFKIIHGQRTRAFQGIAGVPGQGFTDYYNFRWQIFKKRGLVKTMNAIRKIGLTAEQKRAEDRYGAPIAENVFTPSTLLEM